MRAINDVVRALMGQERALSNARAAATRLSRRRVEQQDVELYFADHEAATAADAVDGHEADGTRGLRRG